MEPRIGIPPSLDATGRIRAGRRYHYLDASYAEAVAEAGGRALYLPQLGDPAAALDGMDGLLLPGGDDFAPPAPYPPHVRFDEAAPEQLAFDEALLRGALARGLPVLGICYGMQLLARAHGGGLVYDLPTDLPAAGPHRLPEPDGRHALVWETGAWLRQACADAREVNSLHHQAVASPGEGLRVAARAPDGVVEAVEAADGRFVAGVQWHPEKLPPAGRAPLFRAFVGACAPRRAGARA